MKAAACIALALSAFSCTSKKPEHAGGIPAQFGTALTASAENMAASWTLCQNFHPVDSVHFGDAQSVFETIRFDGIGKFTFESRYYLKPDCSDPYSEAFVKLKAENLRKNVRSGSEDQLAKQVAALEESAGAYTKPILAEVKVQYSESTVGKLDFSSQHFSSYMVSKDALIIARTCRSAAGESPGGFRSNYGTEDAKNCKKSSGASEAERSSDFDGVPAYRKKRG